MQQTTMQHTTMQHTTMKHTTMKHPIIAGLAVFVTSLAVQSAEPKTGPDTTAAAKTNPAGQWRS